MFDMAIIAEGGKVENPAVFSKIIGELMSGSLDVETLMSEPIKV